MTSGAAHDVQPTTASVGSPGLPELLAPVVFDMGAPLLFAPVGGLKSLRNSTIDALDVVDGSAVLELGCGTGGMTEMLLRRGARVTGRRPFEADARKGPPSRTGGDLRGVRHLGVPQ